MTLRVRLLTHYKCLNHELYREKLMQRCHHGLSSATIISVERSFVLYFLVNVLVIA